MNRDPVPTDEPVVALGEAGVGQRVTGAERRTVGGHCFVGPGVGRASWYGDDRCAGGDKRFARTGTNGTYWRRIG